MSMPLTKFVVNKSCFECVAKFACHVKCLLVHLNSGIGAPGR